MNFEKYLNNGYFKRRRRKEISTLNLLRNLWVFHKILNVTAEVSYILRRLAFLVVAFVA